MAATTTITTTPVAPPTTASSSVARRREPRRPIVIHLEPDRRPRADDGRRTVSRNVRPRHSRRFSGTTAARPRVGLREERGLTAARLPRLRVFGAESGRSDKWQELLSRTTRIVAGDVRDQFDDEQRASEPGNERNGPGRSADSQRDA